MDPRIHYTNQSNYCLKCGAWKGQLGLEPTPDLYIKHLCGILDEAKGVIKKSGSLYLNLGDTYCGSWGSEGKKKSSSPLRLDKNNLKKQPRQSPQARIKNEKWLRPKQLLLMPSRIAIALQEEGWILRNDIIYRKSNPMPASVKDRLANTYEHVFHFVKSRRYFYDLDAIREPWTDRNPYDLERARSKHPGYCGKYASGYNAAYRNRIPGQGMRGQPVGDPSRGKNPGDVIRNYHSKATPYRENNPHRERQFGKREAGHPLGKNPGDFWEIKTRPFHGAHFAVYPEKLCETPIKAGCPEFICKKCGKARERIYVRGELVRAGKGHISYGYKGGSKHQNTEKSKISSWSQNFVKDSLVPGMAYEQTFIGYTDCGCEAGWTSGTVLDPFIGSGTTAVVAKKLGRNWIGIDINPDYCRMARKRLALVEDFGKRGIRFC